MGKYRKSAPMAQVSSAIDQFTKEKGLLFRDAFESDALSSRIQVHFPGHRDRIYGPNTSLFALLSQMLSPDRSCSETVARVNTDRITQGLKPASPDNGAYVKARDRIPEDFIHELLTDVGQAIEEKTPIEWLWRGRRVKLVDGSTITMADTPENQAIYGQISSQKEGVGFPITRMMAVFSLATGCVLDLANGPYRGKESGEHGLLRQLLHCFQAGDLVIGDAYFPAYFLIAILQQMGVDCLFAFDGRREMDFRMGERLGKRDHVVYWQKPARPSWMSKEIYKQMPDCIPIRECTVTIERKGYRATKITLVTTLLDAEVTPKEELGWLYGQRWMAELNLAAIKTVLKMEHIRAKTPAMVRKEIWATLLAYNLIRKLIGEAAYQNGLLPREISFKGTVQHFNAFRSLWLNAAVSGQVNLIQELLQLIAQLKVSHRPGRIEPRAIKKRPRPFPRLHISRQLARKEIMKSRMR